MVEYLVNYFIFLLYLVTYLSKLGGEGPFHSRGGTSVWKNLLFVVEKN